MRTLLRWRLNSRCAIRDVLVASHNLSSWGPFVVAVAVAVAYTLLTPATTAARRNVGFQLSLLSPPASCDTPSSWAVVDGTAVVCDPGQLAAVLTASPAVDGTARMPQLHVCGQCMPRVICGTSCARYSTCGQGRRRCSRSTTSIPSPVRRQARTSWWCTLPWALPRPHSGTAPP